MPDADPFHPPARTLRDYRQNRTAPAQTLAVSDHLALCADCRRALAETDDGPGYEELAAAADGLLGPSATAAWTARLADAPAAAAELADLEGFRREMQAQAGRIYGPRDASDPAPAATRKIVVPAAATWRRGMRRIAAVAAALTLLAAGWWTFQRSAPGVTDSLLADPAGRRADLAALPAEVREAVTHALRDGHLEISPVLAALRPRAGVLAGPAATAQFRVLTPVGALVRDPRPALHWTPRADATGYLVTLMEEDGDHPWNSGPLPPTQTGWTPPHALTPGATYSWQVEALREADILDRAPKPPAGEARFRVLAAAERSKLARIETRYGGFPLVMAAAFARMGLTDETSAQLDFLAREHPTSLLARSLRERYRREVQSPSPTSTNGAQ